MEEKDVIKKIQEARLKDIRSDAHRSALKSDLMKYASAKASKNEPFIYKYITAAAVALVFAFSAITFIVVDNMDDGDKFNKNGGVWSAYSDEHQGGDSTVWPKESWETNEGFVMSSPGYGETGWAVRVTGTTGNKLGSNYNYLGVVVRFDSKSACPTCVGSDISEYTGIRFKIKGDLKQGRLTFILPHESNDCIIERKTCTSLTNYADFEKDISASVSPVWQTVVIDFRKDLKQPYWTARKYQAEIDEVLKNVHLFNWQYKNGNGEVMDIWIDDVELF